MLAVHLRVNDTVTNKPTPVRLAITGPNGEAFAPLGRLAEFACGVGEDVGGHLRLGRASYSYIDGSCEVRLPAGVPLRFRVSKGIQYRPLDQTITLGPGQMAIRLAIDAWIPRSGENPWMNGDARAHFLSPHAAQLEAEAEGLDVVNVLAKVHHHLATDGNTHASLPGMVEFTGQSPAFDGEPCVAVNTFNSHPYLGSLSLLNSHRPIFPLAFGEPYGTDDWSLVDWCNQCHRKKGLVVWANPFQPEGGEALVAAILGKVDAFELTPSPKTPVLPWYYHLLNAGVRLPLVGASGKDSNRAALGDLRTMARIGAETPRTYTSWIEAVRAGQTHVTNGPFVTCQVDGGRVSVSAMSDRPFEKLELVADGLSIASVAPTSGVDFHLAVLDLPIPEATWFAARCVGTGQFAHTSPIWIGPERRDPRSVRVLLEQIDRLRDWATTRANFEEDKWRVQLRTHCDMAAGILGDQTQ
jgi:hypothetical protein